MLTVAAVALVSVLCGSVGEPPLSEAIQRVDPVEYRVQMDVSIRSLGRKTLYVPFVKASAYHEVDLTRLKELVRSMPFDRRQPTWEYEVIDFAPLGSYAMVHCASRQSSDTGFRMTEYVTAYSAQIDEGALALMDWPDTWPLEAADTLRSQMYIESADQRVVDMMNAWTAGEPKSVPPYYLGKELARQAVRFYQPNGSEVVKGEKSVITSIRVNGALAAIESRRGPMNDLVCLYVAVCRAGGLPARPVIGIDAGSRDAELVSWAEFFVPTAGWVSVDFRRLYRSPGSMDDANRKWPGFASDDQLNERIALAYFFYAPVIHQADAPPSEPLLWAWSAFPPSRRSGSEPLQTLTIEVDHAPKRGGAGP